MAKAKYTVVSGKHHLGGTEFARQGEEVELEESVAAAFPNKFALVMVPAKVEDAGDAGDVGGEDGKKEDAPPAPAPAPAPAAPKK